MGKKVFEGKVRKFFPIIIAVVFSAFIVFAQAPNPGHLLTEIDKADCTAVGPNHYLQIIGGATAFSCKKVVSAITQCTGQYSYLRGDGSCGDIYAEGENWNHDHHDHYGVTTGGGLQIVPDPDPIGNPDLRGEFGLLTAGCQNQNLMKYSNSTQTWSCQKGNPWRRTNETVPASDIYFNQGFVGIRTTNPSSRLHVDGNAMANEFAASSDITGPQNAALLNANDNGGWLELRNHSLGSNTAGIFGFALPPPLETQAYFTAGNFGIGTSTPSELLEVNKSQAIGASSPWNFTRISINNPDAAGGSTLVLKEGTNQRAFASYNNDNDRFSIGAIEAGAPMIFYTENTEKVRIAANGKIGINENNPAQDLHITSSQDPAIVLDTGAGEWYVGIDAGTNQDQLKFGRGTNLQDAFPIVRLSSDPRARLFLGNTNEGPEVLLEAMKGDGGKITLSNNNDPISETVIRGYSFNGTQAYFKNGNIGIGTSDPKQELHIYDPTGDPGIVIGSYYVGQQGVLAGDQLVFGTGTDIGSSPVMQISSNFGGVVKIPGLIDVTKGKLNVGGSGASAAITVTNNESSTVEPNISYGLYVTGNSNRGIAITNADANCYEENLIGPLIGLGLTTTIPPIPVPVTYVDPITDIGPCSLNDYAEMMEFSQEPKDGQLIIIDTDNPGLLKVSTIPFDPLIAGVASENPAMVIGSYGISIKGWEKTKQDGYYTYPLAIAGRKTIQTTSENGKIVAGDLLVTSSQPGKAMKCALSEIKETDDFETVKQKTMQDELCINATFAKALTGANEKGEVLALITLQ